MHRRPSIEVALCLWSSSGRWWLKILGRVPALGGKPHTPPHSGKRFPALFPIRSTMDLSVRCRRGRCPRENPGFLQFFGGPIGLALGEPWAQTGKLHGDWLVGCLCVWRLPREGESRATSRCSLMALRSWRCWRFFRGDGANRPKKRRSPSTKFSSSLLLPCSD